MPKPSWPSALVAIAMIALVGYSLKLAVDNDFQTIWAGVGTLVGVVTGAIPAYFFQQQAERAQETAADANRRATAAAGAADPEKFEAILRAM